MRRRVGWAAALMGLAASPAIAADLSVKPLVAPPTPAPFWTGFYAGVNLGGVWTTSGADASGVTGGGQLGYNWQFGALVVGGETDIQGTDLHSSRILTSAAGDQITSNRSVDYIGTVRGRLGVAADRWLVYGTGGLAYTTINHNGMGVLGITGNYSASDEKVGFTVGGGVEWAFLDRWSAKAEYLFSQFPSYTNTYTTTTPGVIVHYNTLNVNIGRVGVNYHFAP